MKVEPIVIVILTVWELFWKGITLWKCAQKNQRNWFIAILVINSIGILPIIYLIYTKYIQKKIKRAANK